MYLFIYLFQWVEHNIQKENNNITMTINTVTQ